MTQIQNQQSALQDKEISLKELLFKIKEWINYLKTKWLIILLSGVIGAGVGLLSVYRQKPVYTAMLSFAVEDEKGGGGLSGAMGFATSLGIDLGTSAGGAFSGANLIELMKSRTLVEKALLNPVSANHKRQSLASYFIECNKLNKSWDQKNDLKNIRFDTLTDRLSYTLQQDSIMGILYSAIAGPDGGLLSVSQKDKKISIIYVEVKATDELFAKTFAESLAKEVTEFYVETKSKKAKMNVAILQKQTDSIRNELNAAITGVASSIDYTFGLNPAFNIKRTPTSKRQVDVQANTAILTQLVTNLEMAKVTLLKETPLIQIIDKPILPLKKEKPSKFKSLCIGSFLAVFLVVLWFVGKRTLAIILNEQTEYKL